jgi:hypothetical protein
MEAHLNRITGKCLGPVIPLPATIVTRARDNRRIRRAQGFQRAWLIADRLKRMQDAAGMILVHALLQQWLSEQRRWA